MSRQQNARTVNTLGGAALREQLQGAYLIELPVRRDRRGALVALDHEQGLPFILKRVFYIFDVPNGRARAGHAVSGESVLVAANGSIRVAVDNGQAVGTFDLSRPTKGLYVSPGIMINLQAFTANAVLLVLSSKLYSEIEYAEEAFYSPTDAPTIGR